MMFAPTQPIVSRMPAPPGGASGREVDVVALKRQVVELVDKQMKQHRSELRRCLDDLRAEAAQTRAETQSLREGPDDEAGVHWAKQFAEIWERVG